MLARLSYVKRLTEAFMSANEIRISLRMPEWLKEPLSEAAVASHHSLSDEVRRRLEASFNQPAVPNAANAKTQALLEAIARMAHDLNEWFPAWYDDPFAARVLRRAIDK